MIRVKSALTAVFVAAAAALAVSVFVVSVSAAPFGSGGENPSKAQYSGKGGAREARSGAGYYDFYKRWADATSTEGAGEALSEGSDPAARAPEKKLEMMEPPTPYSQVVDNATPGRFYSAQPWKRSDGRSSLYGRDFRHTRPGKAGAPAWFRVKIPTSGHYTVYARWPATKGNNPETSFRINTASGMRNVKVNQRKDGGTWVRLGAYSMKKSDRYTVQVSGRSKAEGRIVADAVMVVAGTQAAPHDPNEDVSPGGGGPT